MNTRSRHESGSIIIWIFIAIALFAALSFTVANMMQGGDPQGAQKETAKLAASEIIAFGQSVRQGIQAMRISNGCTDSDISFEATGLAGYIHAPLARDECKVFARSGGGVTYLNPAQAFNTAVESAAWVFSGEHPFEKAGTGSAELVMAANVKKIACLELNRLLNIPETGGDAPDDTGGSFALFTGSYGSGAVIGDESPALEGRTAGCFLDSTAGVYRFYQILISR